MNKAFAIYIISEITVGTAVHLFSFTSLISFLSHAIIFPCPPSRWRAFSCIRPPGRRRTRPPPTNIFWGKRSCWVVWVLSLRIADKHDYGPTQVFPTRSLVTMSPPLSSGTEVTELALAFFQASSYCCLVTSATILSGPRTSSTRRQTSTWTHRSNLRSETCVKWKETCTQRNLKRGTSSVHCF